MHILKSCETYSKKNYKYIKNQTSIDKITQPRRNDGHFVEAGWNKKSAKRLFHRGWVISSRVVRKKSAKAISNVDEMENQPVQNKVKNARAKTEMCFCTSI